MIVHAVLTNIFRPRPLEMPLCKSLNGVIHCNLSAEDTSFASKRSFPRLLLNPSFLYRSPMAKRTPFPQSIKLTEILKLPNPPNRTKFSKAVPIVATRSEQTCLHRSKSIPPLSTCSAVASETLFPRMSTLKSICSRLSHSLDLHMLLLLNLLLLCHSFGTLFNA